MLKLAFDEEVTNEHIDLFRKTLHRLRHPNDIFGYFALSGQVVCAPAPLATIKDKNTTLK